MRPYTEAWYDAGAWPRRKLAQAMRTECVRVVGSRWNRPCPLEAVCSPYVYCVCNFPAIVRMRSRCCNRIACSFLKWCRAIPEYAEECPPWRIRWGASSEFIDLPRQKGGYDQPFGLR